MTNSTIDNKPVRKSKRSIKIYVFSLVVTGIAVFLFNQNYILKCSEGFCGAIERDTYAKMQDTQKFVEMASTTEGRMQILRESISKAETLLNK